MSCRKEVPVRYLNTEMYQNTTISYKASFVHLNHIYQHVYNINEILIISTAMASDRSAVLNLNRFSIYNHVSNKVSD